MSATEPKSHSIPTSSASKEVGNITLQCSFKVEAGKTLKIHARIENPGPAGVYVFNRLWDMDASGRPAEDPEKMYRFIRESELRLLLGPAPLPRLKTVFYKNIPYATLIKSQGALEVEQSLALPAEEYSVYFPPTPGALAARARITRVALFVVWVEARRAPETSASAFDPTAVKIEVPDALDYAQTLSCRSTSVDFEGLHRTDEFDRLTLPGEPSEPLQLAH
jgi:hypothetical protein